MTLALRPDVHCALVGRDLVVLDLADDAYHCLPDATKAPGAFQPDALTPAARRLLLKAGLLTAGLQAGAPAAPPARSVARDLRHLPAVRATPGNLLAAALALRDLAQLGRDPSVAHLLSLARTPPGSASNLERVGLAAQAFSQILPWLPFEGTCLRRSALLIAFLRRHGLQAQWVFGVRTWPFRAHCWVQIDDLCLNDDWERLVAYTPIMVA